MATPSFSNRFSNGLGRLSESLFPMDPTAAQNVAPDQIQALRSNALMQLGLGMMGASSRGAGFGESALAGYTQAQTGLQGAMQNAYQNASRSRAETRETEKIARETENDKWTREHTLKQDEAAQTRWDKEQESTRAWRETQAKIDREQMQASRDVASIRLNNGLGTMPSGYRMKADGSGLEFIPGGPADPSIANRAASGKLTEQEQKAVSMAGRMRGAEEELAQTGYTPSGVGGMAAQAANAIPGVGNILTSKDYQKYRQSAMEWITGLLRLDSGAAVPETEFARYFKTYFPQPGDGDDVIKQKAVSRQRAVESLENGLSQVARQRIPAANSGGVSGRWTVEEVR